MASNRIGRINEEIQRELAELIKSWNYLEAAVGQAAINAWYNSPEIARQNGVDMDQSPREDRMNDPFIMSQREIRGKRWSPSGISRILKSCSSRSATLPSSSMSRT